MSTQNKCVIWGTALTNAIELANEDTRFHPNQGIKDLIHQRPFIYQNRPLFGNYIIYNPWAGGKYTLSRKTFSFVGGGRFSISEEERIRLSGYVAQENLNNKTPSIDAIMKGDDWLSNLPDIPDEEERAFMLLKSLKVLEPGLGEEIPSCIIQDRSVGGYRGVFTAPFLWAVSYCCNVTEFDFLLFDLKQKEFINASEPIDLPPIHPLQPIKEVHIRITPKGLRKIKNIQNRTPNQNSQQAFIAMWIDSSVDTVKTSIQKAIKEAGYKPLRIDDKSHNNKICDEILSEIKESRFIICDLTSESGKPRGSVYFEAGYAKGIGRDVIFTCNKALEKEMAFDIRQYPIIFWEKNNMEDFIKKLKDKIKGTIQ